jgi:hypothetical protein
MILQIQVEAISATLANGSKKTLVKMHPDVGRLCGVSANNSVCNSWIETRHRFRGRFPGAADY